jgi:hypothetical protein
LLQEEITIVAEILLTLLIVEQTGGNGQARRSSIVSPGDCF